MRTITRDKLQTIHLQKDWSYLQVGWLINGQSVETKNAGGFTEEVCHEKLQLAVE